MARSGISVEAFAAGLTERAAASLSEGDFTFWELPETDPPRILATSRNKSSLDPIPSGATASRAAFVQKTVQTGDFLQYETGSGPGGESIWSLISVVDASQQTIRFLELTARFSSDELRDWTGDVLKSLGELCADFFRDERLRTLTIQQGLWRRIAEIAGRWQQVLVEERLGALLVQDLRQLTGCERVSLLSTDRGSCRVISVSGANLVNRRSDAMRAMEQLAHAAVIERDALWLESRSNQIPSNLRAAAADYFDSAGSRWLGLWPLHRPGTEVPGTESPPVAGILLVEGFQEPAGAMVRTVLELVSPLAASSLAAAQRVGRIPGAGWWLGSVWQDASSPAGRRHWWLALAIVGLVTASWPVRFEIEARGELQPRNRREVFAPFDARVTKLHVEHGAEVEAGEVLLELQSPELELEHERVWGELETTRRRLSAIESARGAGGGDRTEREPRTSQLSGEEAALREQLASLLKQLQIVSEQQSMLEVRSPINGRLLTWNVSDLLQGRPVQRGQALLTVADASGAWMLDLRVANRRAGHVLDAQQTTPEGLALTYVLAIDPSRSHTAHVTRVSRAIETEAGNEPFLRVGVDVDRSELQDPRPGSGTTARIDCGRRPLIYAWFHDLIDAIRGWGAL